MRVGTSRIPILLSKKRTLRIAVGQELGAEQGAVNGGAIGATIGGALGGVGGLLG